MTGLTCMPDRETHGKHKMYAAQGDTNNDMLHAMFKVCGSCTQHGWVTVANLMLNCPLVICLCSVGRA